MSPKNFFKKRQIILNTRNTYIQEYQMETTCINEQNLVWNRSILDDNM